MRWDKIRKTYNDIGKRHSWLLSKSVLGTLAVLAIGAVAFAPWAKVAADTIPSGEVQFHQNSIEPGYDDLTGGFTYFMTPEKAPEHANTHAVAPLYIVMYPTSASGVGVLNCQYESGTDDNCPSHGATLEGFAKAEMPSVYGGGVWGHDHLLAAPPSTQAAGGDFNVAWLPVVVLFTSSSAANTHITTLDQLHAALAKGDVEEISLPSATFQCVIVPEGTYEMGTPAY